MRDIPKNELSIFYHDEPKELKKHNKALEQWAKEEREQHEVSLTALNLAMEVSGKRKQRIKELEYELEFLTKYLESKSDATFKDKIEKFRAEQALK